MHRVTTVRALAAALLASLCLASPSVPAPTLTAEPPQISGGGEASGRPLVSEVPPAGAYPMPGRPRLASPFGFVGRSFEGFAYDDNFTQSASLAVPPEPIGAAGPNRLIAVVSSMLEARDKNGGLIFRDALKDF